MRREVPGFSAGYPGMRILLQCHVGLMLPRRYRDRAQLSIVMLRIFISMYDVMAS